MDDIESKLEGTLSLLGTVVVQRGRELKGEGQKVRCDGELSTVHTAVSNTYVCVQSSSSLNTPKSSCQSPRCTINQSQYNRARFCASKATVTVQIESHERSGCPTCNSLQRMFLSTVRQWNENFNFYLHHLKGSLQLWEAKQQKIGYDSDHVHIYSFPTIKQHRRV